ncbi:MAG: hypothetical protein NCW75_00185 [Phycisphaera sp.]|nr:MAG: hypothetical protein NCW75_00185 [Phycisphaera sp.]
MFKSVRSFDGLTGRVACVVSACGMAISAPALATPVVLDYVPEDAMGVVAINNLGGAMGDMRAFMDASSVPLMGGEMQAMLAEVDGVGVNAGGSAAFFFTGGPDGESIMLLPVTSYKEFVTARGGVGAGVEEINFGGQDAFVKQVSDSYIAMSDNDLTLEDWEPTKGHQAAHVSAMGTRSQAAAESADVFIMGSIASLAADWRESYEGMKGMAMMMGGPEAAQGFAAADPLVAAFLTDAQAGVIAIDFENDGVTARLLSRFKEGSLLAGLFQGKSSTEGLLDSLPDMPFGLALSFDTSSPGMKSIMSMVEEGAGDQQPAQAQAMMDAMKNSSGGAIVLGAPSMQEMSIGAGAFVRSAAYYRSAEPAKLQKAMAEGMLAADGQTVEQDGMTITTTTSYRPEARTIEGVTVDEWGVATNIEGEANEQAMQAQMAMSMIFGSNGLGGYVAPAKDGVVMTMSRNSQMLTQTLGTANNGGGLGSGDSIGAVSAKLPNNRAFELYIGVDHLMGIGAAFLGDIPPMPPVGIVAASGDGTAEIALHISPAVISKGMELGMMFGGAMGGPGMDFEDEGDGGPAF